MHAKKHLLLFDPIKLLHTNVTSNFFALNKSKGQHSDGSCFLTHHCHFGKVHCIPAQKPTPPKKVHSIIWEHSLEDLLTFLSATLRYMWTFSKTSVDYLTGLTFPATNLLDTKTFQKTQNLYQYLHFNSCHPMSTFKGLIIGECRYVRINSSKDNYLATLEQFKQRLYNRL